MANNSGSRSKFIFIELIMFEKQSKNIIKAVSVVLLSVIIGEGVFGLGLFWPFLLILLDWRGVYWLSVFVGILISGLYHMPIGMPSLFLVVIVGALSFIISSGRESGWIMLIVSLVANLVFDKVFGFSWSLWDPIFVVIAWAVAVRWFESSETIKINY